MDVCGRIGEGEDWEKKISGQLQVRLRFFYPFYRFAGSGDAR